MSESNDIVHYTAVVTQSMYAKTFFEKDESCVMYSQKVTTNSKIVGVSNYLQYKITTLLTCLIKSFHRFYLIES